MADLLTLEELDVLGINPVAIASFDADQKASAIAAAVDEVYSYIRAVTGTPITNAPLALKLHTARIAVYHLLMSRGMDPDDDRLIVDAYDRAIRFLKGVASRDIILSGMTPPEDNPADDNLGPEVFSDPPRWDWP